MAIEQVLLDFTQISVGNPLFQSALVGLARGIFGWIENATGDGKITWPELKKLLETIFRMIPQVLGLGALLGDIGPAAAFFSDWVLVKIANALKKK